MTTEILYNKTKNFINEIDWFNTDYFRLDSLFFGESENILELSSGTNLLNVPKIYKIAFKRNYYNSNLVNIYSNPLGINDVRISLKLYESIMLGEDIFQRIDLAITSGASDALRLAFKYMKKLRKKKVLVLGLQYPIVFQNILNNDLTFKCIVGKPDNGFLPSIDLIEKHIKCVDCVFMTQPNNPSGTIYSNQELKKILKIIKQNNIFLIYEKIGFDLMSSIYDNTDYDYSEVVKVLHQNNYLIIDSFSKRRPVSGIRIGYIIGSKEFINNFVVEERFGDCPNTTITNALILDSLLCSIIVSKKKDYEIEHNSFYSSIIDTYSNDVKRYYKSYYNEIKKMYKIIDYNKKLVLKKLSKYTIMSTKLDAGSNFLICLYKPLSLHSDYEYVKNLFIENNIAAYPLSCFYYGKLNLNYDDRIWLRVSIAIPTFNLLKILNEICDFYE